ncbi:aromatic-ring-hydroxylating dioxygenase subunit beta [Pararhodobacter zhoushanensis]|uniref:Aromatic-ring-hydroxylating dioxygenase subunit beta n=1 Tax=Pararhodobacter zhoushanensis TaxID=2479545 RepID=A0ABT3GXH0_9RHOB|nr:aromatic-ring-hydroxylating dioxygenase subunit beta [Pararhodobacter zhoushanensis]MCW1932253.1 aromatic-ring-hydroxylating dioxygenase subunit beta [Pararhodobacter zhoushanensis]
MKDVTNTQDLALLSQVSAFIWAEADMLDAKAYEDWLELWTRDGLYIMPMGEGEDYANSLNLCYDNDKMRRDRIGRFRQGFSISSAPAAQTVRAMSRFVIEKVEGDTVTVRCAEQLVEDKFGRQRLFAANTTYTLIRQPEGGFRIAQKVARLLNSDGMLTSLSYLF